MYTATNKQASHNSFVILKYFVGYSTYTGKWLYLTRQRWYAYQYDPVSTDYQVCRVPYQEYLVPGTWWLAEYLLPRSFFGTWYQVPVPRTWYRNGYLVTGMLPDTSYQVPGTEFFFCRYDYDVTGSTVERPGCKCRCDTQLPGTRVPLYRH